MVQQSDIDHILYCSALGVLESIKNRKKKKKNYTLSRKKKRFNTMFGALGSTSGNKFYMGTQNGSKLKVLIWMDFFIHTFKLKICPLEFSPMFVQGSHVFAMFSAHALRDGSGYAHINMTTCTWFSQNCNIASLLALYGCSYTVVLSQGIIPSFSVCNTANLGIGGTRLWI